MTNVHDCAFLLYFTLKIKELPKCNEEIFFVWVFTSKYESSFSANQNCVSLRCRVGSRVKIRGLKSSIEVQLPIVSGNLKYMLYSCLCTSFVSCYCVLTEKIDENDNVVTIDHFSRFRVGSLLVSFGDSNVWPSGLLRATVTQLPIWVCFYSQLLMWVQMSTLGLGVYLTSGNIPTVKIQCSIGELVNNCQSDEQKVFPSLGKRHEM